MSKCFETMHSVKKIYGEKLRVRVCGLCFSGEDLLLVKHKALTEKGCFFSPPGGGMEFGESAEECLKREFHEETGLKIIVKDFLFIHEFLSPPLHAIELFFVVEAIGGVLKTGFDPEMGAHEQILEGVQFMAPERIKEENESQMHQMLNRCERPRALLNMQGYFKFDDKTLK